MTSTIQHKRALWQCRRGLLELELLLTPFVTSSYAQMNVKQQKILHSLLNYSDTSLYALLNGSETAETTEENEIIQMISDTTP